MLKKTPSIIACTVSFISLFLMASTQLFAQGGVDTLQLVFYQPSCSAKVVDSVECAQMARGLVRDLSDFYEPILDRENQKRWVQLYVKKTFKERLPDDLETDPAADMMVWFDLTAQTLEVRVKDVLTGESITEVELPVKSTKPAALRKLITDASQETTRKIMRAVYDEELGQKNNIRIKTPTIKDFSMVGAAPKNGRWQALPLSREGLYSSFPATADDKALTITPVDVIVGKTFPDWRIRTTVSPSGTIDYRMAPYRLTFDVSGGLALPDGEATGWSHGALSLLLNPKFSLRAGGAYFVLPMETVVEPIDGIFAEPQVWREGTVVPFIGVGYQMRDLTLGIRFGFTVDGFIVPRYVRGGLWLAAEKIPWLRLTLAYQTINMEAEQRTFSRNTPAALTTWVDQNYSFISSGIGLYLPLK